MTAADALRPGLWADRPVEAWPPGDEVAGEPWTSFVAARRALAAGDTAAAIAAWQAITSQPDTEARNVLQAWHLLRLHGVAPAEELAGRVLGVVCEVAVGDQHDVLAGYADGSARYLNHAGGASVFDGGPPEVVARVADLLVAGQAVADAIGPWNEPGLPELPAGQTRFCMLTPGGFRFGQGPDDVLRDEVMAEPLYAAATALLVAAIG